MSDFIRKMTTFSLLLFTGFCFLKAGAGLVSGDSDLSLTEVEAAVPARIAEPQLQTTPIQQMRPGMRVLGRNPDRWDTQSVVEPDSVSWRLVSVRMEQQQPGQFVLGQLLRPLSWIRQNNALPGAVIQLEIPEMHVSDEVISVFVEGEPEPIGTTSQHPFWSRDRNAFVPAGELRIGEELKTALGTSTRVTSIEIRAGPETVYGLEVAGEHVYQITNAGLLVHNACGKGGGNLNAPDVSAYKVRKNSEGLTVRAEGVVSGPHPGRKKGYRPEPVGGRAKGHHRGHLVPENMVDNPSLVNVQSNIISEAAKSNLSPKRTFEKLAGRIAAENPNSIVKTIHFPKRRPGETVPFLVTHYITVDGKMVHGVSIPNK
tara:strand:- start:2546 stop:3661 length:1116 start_codon:yes stop_codon:yes gene_type:complete